MVGKVPITVFSVANLDGGEHRATMDPGDGGNDPELKLGKVQEPIEKSSSVAKGNFQREHFTSTAFSGPSTNKYPFYIHQQ
jgi:hypothetical protein